MKEWVSFFPQYISSVSSTICFKNNFILQLNWHLGQNIIWQYMPYELSIMCHWFFLFSPSFCQYLCLISDFRVRPEIRTCKSSTLFFIFKMILVVLNFCHQKSLQSLTDRATKISSLEMQLRTVYVFRNGENKLYSFFLILNINNYCSLIPFSLLLSMISI